MARTRALLTERERNILAGDDGREKDREFLRWELDGRISDELPRDIRILAEHHPDLLDKLHEVVDND